MLNPRQIPKGTRILRRDVKDWYEGDDFVKPANMSDASVKDYVARGFLKENV